MIWFTSDYHLCHTNIIKYDNRPFESADQMYRAIVTNHNALVTPTDTVYFLGDFCWDPRFVKQALEALNGRFIMVWGNHDRKIRKFGDLFAECHELLQIKYNDQDITLCHYPMRSWNKSHHGAWHLHGHCHGHLPKYGKSFDVCTALWDYKPLSFNQVGVEMAQLVANGHHERPPQDGTPEAG
jgi:calcineurin-like phosphoesterase family protein